jgi:hypothetical protein
MEKEIKINGFTVTFMTFDDDTGNSNNCYVQKGRFSHSLALLQDLGEFQDGEGNTLEISPATIDKIEAWALAQGY